MVTMNGSEMLFPIPPFPGSDPDPGDPKPISVLYVDDIPALVDLVYKFFDRDGKMMVDASLSLEEAMNKMKYISYDAIVTDYNNRDGNKLLREVRAKGERIPFVYFISHRVARYEAEAKQLGEVSFIEKIGSKGTNFNRLRQEIFLLVREYRKRAVLWADQPASSPDGAAKS